jgi:hypothetical protein
MFDPAKEFASSFASGMPHNGSFGFVLSKG